LAEFPQLRVSVSLLVQYEECDHCHDWTVGIHGIMIRWMDDLKQTEYSSTYLPEVAAEQGWDQVTAVTSLIRKAGYHGRASDDLLQKITCTRYQSSKQKVTFDEYVQRRGHDPSSLLQGHDGRQTKSAKSSPSSDCSVQ
jgi:AMMECR1 domain-containing protein